MNWFFKKKKFPDPLDTVVYTTVFVIDENSRITLVSHEIDGDWQFMGDEPVIDYQKIGRVVSLAEIMKIDKTVLDVADLQRGYQATRRSKKDKWQIVKIEYSDDEIAEMGFIRSECGERHRELPMSYVSDAPYLYFQIPPDQQSTRVQLTKDTCIIDDELFYIRGQLNIPVDDNETFCWTVWVLISQADYESAIELWTDENRFLEKPYDGKLSTKLECYPNTLNIDVKLHTQKPGTTPKIEVIECSHPIFFEQEHGITMARVAAFARQIIYGH